MNGGLYCASQALSPIVIRLGARTGGSVCLGLQPSHVVAARSPPPNPHPNPLAPSRTFRECGHRKTEVPDRETPRTVFLHMQCVSHVVEGEIRAKQAKRVPGASARKVC